MAKETSVTELTEKHKKAFCDLTGLAPSNPKYHAVIDSVEADVQNMKNAWMQDMRISPSNPDIPEKTQNFRMQVWRDLVENARRIDAVDHAFLGELFGAFTDTQLKSLDKGLRNAFPGLAPRSVVNFFNEFSNHAARFKEQNVSVKDYADTIAIWMGRPDSGLTKAGILMSAPGIELFFSDDIISSRVKNLRYLCQQDV